MRTSLPLRPHAPSARALLSTTRAVLSEADSSPAHDYRTGGWMDPFEDNPDFRSQASPSDSDPLEVNLEEYVDPSTDRAAKGWAPRGSDFMDAQSTIPQRERAALSHLFSQYEQRMSDALPAHSAPDFSHLGRKRSRANEADAGKTVAAHAPVQAASDGQDALRAFARNTRLRTKIFSPYREVLRESTTVSAQQMEAVMKQVSAELLACPSEVAVWSWAEANVFPPTPAPGAEDDVPSSRRTYGMNTPYYQPVLVELVITLRDYFRSPHMAVALYERMKNVSLASYVLGCSGMLVKEMLQVFWGSFHDYDRVAQIVTEAQAAGVISYRNKRSKRASPDEEPLHQLINRINDEVSSEIRTLHTELITLSPEQEGPATLQREDMFPPQPQEEVLPLSPTSADPVAQQDFWSPAPLDERPRSAGMPDVSASDLLPEENGHRPMDLHDLAGSLQEAGDDVFGQVFPEETDVHLIRTASPFPGAPAGEHESLPGRELHTSPRGRTSVTEVGTGSLQRMIKTDLTGELLAARVSMVSQQLGLDESTPRGERGQGRRRFNHPNFHRPPHNGQRHGPRAF